MVLMNVDLSVLNGNPWPFVTDRYVTEDGREWIVRSITSSEVIGRLSSLIREPESIDEINVISHDQYFKSRVIEK